MAKAIVEGHTGSIIQDITTNSISKIPSSLYKGLFNKRMVKSHS